MTRSRISEDDEGERPDEGSLVVQAVEMLVERAESRLETADTLAEALRDLIVPQTFGTDLYDPDGNGTSGSMRIEDDDDDDTFPYDSMVKFFLYEKVKSISDNELQDELDKWSHRVRWLGADRAPRQQTFSYTWDHRFTPQTRHAIEVAAEAIGNAAADEGVIREALAPRNLTDEDTGDEEMPKREYKRQRINKTTELARRHAVPFFKTGRADNKKYSDRDIFETQARMCTTKTAAYSEGQVGWLTDDDYTPDGSTLLRAFKQVGQDGDESHQSTLQDIADAPHPLGKINRVRDDVLKPFTAATENVLKSIEGEGAFNDRMTIGAIDITPEPFFPSPWEDKDEGIPKEDFPRMVSGYKGYDKDEEGSHRRCYLYATITLVGPKTVPLIVGIEPVKYNSGWEDDDAPSHTKAEIVDRLLKQAEQKGVDLDMVLFDRGINGHAVRCIVEEHGISYVAPEQRYTDEWEDIKAVEEHPDADAAVKHGVEVSADVGRDHECEQMYVPTRSDDVNENYAVFQTNHEYVEPKEIHHWPNIYRRRWDTEITFKSLKEFLPRTSSKNYRVRFHNFVFAALIYNLWRLTDYLVKMDMDRDIRSPPVLTAKTFSRALGDFLRERKFLRKYG